MALLCHTLALLFTLSIFGLSEAADDGGKRYANSVKVPFFVNVSMTCDHQLLNISTSSDDVDAISWVFPDGTNVYSADEVNPRFYNFSNPTGDAALHLYNLTALEIDEDQFGYYFCVVKFKSSKAVAVIRWGLNVHGADFSELLNRYRKNAIVGGAAAAALLLLIGGGCLLWNVRYGNRDLEDDDDPGKNGVEEVARVRDNGERKFTNAAFNGEEEERAVIDVHM